MKVVHHRLEENDLYKHTFFLAVLTIIFSTLEGSFSVYYGYESNSLTLFGNGVVSFIEVISGFGIAGMMIRIKKKSKENPNDFERMALRITGIGLYILSFGLVVMSVADAFTHQHPTTTLLGIIIAIITIAIIGSLVVAKMKVGNALHSKALLADAKCTRICVYMSMMVFIASVIYELTRFAYADAIGALGLAYFAYKEAQECFAFR